MAWPRTSASDSVHRNMSERTKTPGEPSGRRAHFGFQDVDEAEKQGRVNDVFSKVAGKYDQMNDLMSGGLHRLWKDDMVTWLNPPRGDRSFDVLDVAGGTGDISCRILTAGGKGTTTTLCDINPAMIAEGRTRARRQGHLKRCRFSVGNAEALPFPDASFDAYTIAFGIRNVTHIDKALSEAQRVLKPGGRFLCLEFSQVTVPGMDALYDAYSFTAVPAIGKVVTGDGQPYRYLVESIRKFPNQEIFEDMMCEAGLANVKHRNLSGGIVALHSGWKV